ncbi:MAG: hypothetical protein ACREIA_15605 [Opitutaceae bacterium]
MNFSENFRGNLEAAPRFIAREPKAFTDFALARAAPQIDAGDFLTRTPDAGRGGVLRVVDARYFCDGFDIVEGDLIQLEGSKEAVRITRVDYERNELHLDRPLRWKAGQGVALSFRGGAIPSPLTAATGVKVTSPRVRVDRREHGIDTRARSR